MPVLVFISGIFRKPRTGVWEFLTRNSNGNKSIDIKQSFYCGDAAGRTKKVSDGKKDFSCSDRLFAMNLDLHFYTPEQFFLGRKSVEDFKLPDFNPMGLEKRFKGLETKNQKLSHLLEGNPKNVTLLSIKPEVIMMIGVQGSGKSTIASQWLGKAYPNYVVLSNDKLGGRDRTIAALKSNLKSGNSCVIDNTHVDVEARRKFLEVVKEFKYPVRAFVMTTTFDHAKHNNIFREIIDTSKEHAKIGEPLLHQFKNKYQAPTKEEGFDEVVKVNFVPEFSYEQHRQIYFKYLQEK